MNFLVQFGVGLIVQTIQSAKDQQALKENAESAAATRQRMAEVTEEGRLAMFGDDGQDPFSGDDPTAPMASGLAFAEAPPFPDEAAQNLQDMQATHASQLQSLSEQFLDSATAMKTELFSDNHLATTTPDPTPEDPTPQPQVALGDNGKPQVQPGTEQPVQQDARETYEADQKQALTQQHTTENQQFLGQEKANVQQFLAENRPDLSNPAVQQELHKLLAQGQKRALQLTTSQESEMLKHDAYTPEMEANVNNFITAKSSLQQKQSQVEEDSDDAATLYQHQQDLSTLLQQKKDELQESTQQDSFLTRAPKFNDSPQSPTDVATVLPPYLSTALYGMGIYEV